MTFGRKEYRTCDADQAARTGHATGNFQRRRGGLSRFHFGGLRPAGGQSPKFSGQVTAWTDPNVRQHDMVECRQQDCQHLFHVFVAAGSKNNK